MFYNLQNYLYHEVDVQFQTETADSAPAFCVLDLLGIRSFADQDFCRLGLLWTRTFADQDFRELELLLKWLFAHVKQKHAKMLRMGPGGSLTLILELSKWIIDNSYLIIFHSLTKHKHAKMLRKSCSPQKSQSAKALVWKSPRLQKTNSPKDHVSNSLMGKKPLSKSPFTFQTYIVQIYQLQIHMQKACRYIRTM